jgi:hypothetical protein
MTSAHRTLQHLVEGEAYRRIMTGELPMTLGEFAQQLLDWLREAHPDVAPAIPHTVEDLVRETWHRRHEMIRGG